MTAANTAVQLELDSPEKRNRATVAFRALLVLPQYVIANVLGFAVGFVLLPGWVAALATGRLPNWVRTFAGHYIGYQVRVLSYHYLLVDRYPPFAFTSPAVRDYPVQLDMPEAGRLSRVKVLFRLLLAIPAILVITAGTYGWMASGFFIWLSVLITGRTPRPVFDASAAIVRYLSRFHAWYCMLTDKYPAELAGDKYPEAVEQRSATRPLVLSRAGMRLLITLIVIGALAYTSYTVYKEVVIQPALTRMLLEHLHLPHK